MLYIQVCTLDIDIVMTDVPLPPKPNFSLTDLTWGGNLDILCECVNVFFFLFVILLLCTFAFPFFLEQIRIVNTASAIATTNRINTIILNSQMGERL